MWTAQHGEPPHTQTSLILVIVPATLQSRSCPCLLDSTCASPSAASSPAWLLWPPPFLSCRWPFPSWPQGARETSSAASPACAAPRAAPYSPQSRGSGWLYAPITNEQTSVGDAADARLSLRTLVCSGVQLRVFGDVVPTPGLGLRRLLQHRES